ncbi:hypothetical protein E2C01_022572 [Portunus trituberculatus]|uniref:Uncharacterized protein n=1 Tax=Portunus trituberculatus TaxID=210409 RepID=A0A5B7E988_PORTR|nr:hypothetical protein [Portunus trituberculatus]
MQSFVAKSVPSFAIPDTQSSIRKGAAGNTSMNHQHSPHNAAAQGGVSQPGVHLRLERTLRGQNTTTTTNITTTTTTHLLHEDIATSTELLLSGCTSNCPYLARAAETRPGDALMAPPRPCTTSHGGRLVLGSAPARDCRVFSALTGGYAYLVVRDRTEKEEEEEEEEKY